MAGGQATKTHANRLIGQASPYLLQHAHNPVDWFPWGDEAFEKARAEDKPIFLSIGYSTCHWCHVMERESFEDEQTAVQAYQAVGKAAHAAVARDIFDYVLRDMTDPGGGFYAGEDADSEGREGAFYVWREDEIRQVLGESDAKGFCDDYGVTDTGNFEQGENILHVVGSISQTLTAFTAMLLALDYRLGPTQEIVVTGPADQARSLLEEVRHRFLPNATLLFRETGARGDAVAEMVPFGWDLVPLDGCAAAYVCENHACRRPVVTAGDLAASLDGIARNR